MMLKKILCLILVSLTVALAFPVSAAAEDIDELNPKVVLLSENETPMVEVSSATGIKGDTVNVTVAFKNNPGIAAFRFYIDFNTKALRPLSVIQGDALSSGNIYSNVSSDGITVLITTWDNAFDIANDGTAFTITFRIQESAAVKKYPICIYYDQADVCNERFEDVTFGIVNGEITVIYPMILLSCNPYEYKGNTAKVDIIIKDNPGLSSFLLCLNYDASKMSFLRAENGEVFDNPQINLNAANATISIVSNAAETYYNNGCVCSLYFDVKDNSPLGSVYFDLSYDADATLNADGKAVPFFLAKNTFKIVDRSLDRATSLEFEYSREEIDSGDSGYLSAKVNNPNGYEILWETNTEAVELEPFGRSCYITGKKIGRAKVTAYILDAYGNVIAKDHITVRVTTSHNREADGYNDESKSKLENFIDYLFGLLIYVIKECFPFLYIFDLKL